MKKKNASNSKFKGLYLSFLLLILCAGAVPAQNDKTRTVEKTFDGKTALWASHRYGDLVLKKGAGSQIRAVLTITASAKNDEDLQQFLNRFELTASEAPDNKVDIKTDDIIKNWKSVNGRTTIKFNDGQSFSGIQNFKMTLEIFVPKLRYATLENKYAAIKVEEGTAATLEIKMYDGAVDAPGQFENLTLDLKYGRGSVGHFGNCNAVLYDYDLTLGNGGAITMESKYSGLHIGNLQSLKLNCFDDDFRIGGVSGVTDIQDKYSEFHFSGNLSDASFRLYDSKVEAKNGGDIRVFESKYTEFSFQELNSLQFDSSFDDQVQVVKVGALSAVESKYTEFSADGLWKSLNFPASFDDDIRVRNVGGSFEGLTFNGKYSDLTLPIPASVKYEIDAELKYGKLVFPESGMETSYYKEKGDEITLKARAKGASENAPKLNIKSYDGAIRLE